MLNKLIESILGWITLLKWTKKLDISLDAEMDKFGGNCWYEETKPKLNRDGTWEKSKIHKINVSLGRCGSGWGDVETSVPLVECFNSVIDELVFNKRSRKLFLLKLIELFKDNPSLMKV